MERQLTKAEKKLSRELIEKGVQQEFANALQDMDAILTSWKNKEIDNREAYQTLYKKLDEHDDHIADRYDGMSGGRYLFTVGILLADGLISLEDIEGYQEDSKNYLKRFLMLRQ